VYWNFGALISLGDFDVKLSPSLSLLVIKFGFHQEALMRKYCTASIGYIGGDKVNKNLH
jgi:hypothetical protein